MSIARLQQAGRDAYRAHDYAKALEHFNKAVGYSDPTPQLLDNLAATHVKLGDLPAALQATKKAIRVGREDPTGYLRAGLILQKMEKPSVALEIYAGGLRSVKHIGVGYEQLKKVHDELMKQMAPPNSIDPLTVLPRELAISVLEYLTFRQRIAVCRVSKGWNDFIRSEPNLWAHLDLSKASAKVKPSFVSVAINKSKSKLTSATLHRLIEFDKVLEALIRHTPLQKLTLLATGLQGPQLARLLKNATKLSELRILAGTEIGESTLMEITNACQSRLEVLHCIYVSRLDFRTRWKLQLPKLRSLSLTTGQLDGTVGFFDALSHNAPELRSLTVYEGAIPSRTSPLTHIDLRNCAKLEHVDLRLGFRTSHQLQLPPSVRQLHLATALGLQAAKHFFPDYDAPDTDSTGLVLLDLPLLEELRLVMPGLGFSSVAREFSATRQVDSTACALADLKYLTLREPSMPELGNFGFGSRLTKLEHLTLQHTQELKDEHVEIIAKQLKSLQSLDLSGTPITGVAVRSIVEAGQVKRLLVNDCQNLGRDAVDWAKAQGINVEFRATSLERGGRKVNY